jgi:hypothetical protein
LVLFFVEMRLDQRRERLSVGGVAEREVVVLDREDVREVRANVERQIERHGVHRLVLEDEAVLHRLSDEPLADDRDLVL